MPIVSIKSSSKQFEVEEKSIIFDALDNQGETLPHGCLSGSCGACKVEVTKGAENLKPPSEIEKNTIEAIKQNYERMHGKNSTDQKTIRLSCRARVLGDVEIDELK